MTNHYKPGTKLNGGPLNWHVAFDTNLPPPTTICEQVPFSLPFSVAAGVVTSVNLPAQVMTADYDVVETNSIHLTADQSVSVYGFFYEYWVSTAFTGFPVPLLGTNYCLMAYPGLTNFDYPSDFGIVATEDNTTVTVTPSATANLVGGSTNAYTNILNQGQTYQGASYLAVGDVTGTRIVSDKPVAVFAGAKMVFVPEAYQAGNPLMQQQVPVEQWGLQVLSMGFAGRMNGDTYRVLAAYTNTVVWTNGVVAGTNQAGEFLEMIIDGPVWFQANQPIQVAHFGNGHDFDSAGVIYGDPCEVLLPPVGHWLETNIVYTVPNEYITGDFAEDHLNIIVPRSASTNTLVDDSIVPATNFVAIGASGYYGAQITITNSGPHTVTCSQPVGVEVYGWGDFDAYGYFGGIVR